MTLAFDYAQAFELEVRRRRSLAGRARRLLALALWGVLFLVRPRLALQIWDERR